MDTPPDVKLLDGESVRKIIPHPQRLFLTHPSSLQEMMRLTNASASHEIGMNGPSIASLAFDVSQQTSVPPGVSPLEEYAEETIPAPDHLRLYEVVFGRDSLRVAIELIPSYPQLARTTLLLLAQMQGVEYNASREEEPGRILHEAREADDPIARKLSQRLGWGWPYYGSVDATPEFIRTLAAYVKESEENGEFLTQTYTDKSGETRQMAYALDMTVDWILHKLDGDQANNPEGLLEFKSHLPTGIENQVWKDSWDAYHHADGSLANHEKGVASIEVQVTTYDALLDAALLYENILNLPAKADYLRNRAEKLKKAILNIFWVEDAARGDYFALGVDRDDTGMLRQLRIRTSNMGHVLHSRLLDGDDPEIVRKRELVVQHLLSPAMLNVSGIRTLANDEIRFRPGAYHNGSVWLWDTHHISKGLRHHGYTEAADDLDRRLLGVVDATKLFPEYVRGDDANIPTLNTRTVILWDEQHQRKNQLEQPPQEVQAWTVAAILAIKKRIGQDYPHHDTAR